MLTDLILITILLSSHFPDEEPEVPEMLTSLLKVTAAAEPGLDPGNVNAETLTLTLPLEVSELGSDHSGP